MFEIMRNGDLNMYYSGTFMRHENSVVYVEQINGDLSDAVAVTSSGDIPMSELSVYYPDTCAVQYQGSAPLLISHSSGRNYKKSYRDSRGSRHDVCRALTAHLQGTLPTLGEAETRLQNKRSGHCVFGISGRFYLRKTPDYSVPCIFHMEEFIGYLHEGRAILSSDIPDVLVERLAKNAGGYNVVVEK